MSWTRDLNHITVIVINVLMEQWGQEWAGQGVRGGNRGMVESKYLLYSALLQACWASIMPDAGHSMESCGNLDIYGIWTRIQGRRSWGNNLPLAVGASVRGHSRPGAGATVVSHWEQALKPSSGRRKCIQGQKASGLFLQDRFSGGFAIPMLLRFYKLVRTMDLPALEPKSFHIS